MRGECFKKQVVVSPLRWRRMCKEDVTTWRSLRNCQEPFWWIKGLNAAWCGLRSEWTWESEDMGKTCVGTALLRCLVLKGRQRNEEVLEEMLEEMLGLLGLFYDGRYWRHCRLPSLDSDQPSQWYPGFLSPWLDTCALPSSIVPQGLPALGKSHHLLTDSCNQALEGWWRELQI